MIVVLGASGYLGQAFVQVLQQRDQPFVALARSRVDYTRPGVLLDYLRATKPSFLINAAGCTGVPNVDACETAWTETLLGNTIFPHAVALACLTADVP
jgi:dTDP-4-dehydrorhamnose reductase